MKSLATSFRFVACPVLFLLVCLSACCQDADTASPGKLGTYSAGVSTTWNGMTRYYDLYVPNNLSASPPLWVMLHATSVVFPGPFDRPAMTDLADDNGMIVVWPISTYIAASKDYYWDSYFLDLDFESEPDDSGFICSLIHKYQRGGPVYVAGMSSGGFMAERVANECPGITAFGAASAQVYVENSVNMIPPNVGQPSGILLNGDADTEVPYCGSTKHIEWGKTASPSSDVSLGYWAGVIGAQESATLCENGQPTSVVSEAISGGSGNLQFVREVGCGHVWVPGTEQWMYQFFTTTRVAQVQCSGRVK